MRGVVNDFKPGVSGVVNDFEPGIKFFFCRMIKKKKRFLHL
jgi:hypothetical protein